ncbi:FAD-dependent monooxygenase [Streptacidiphilus jiangxiensis]|uniref:Oxygenase/bifunctional oxygenase/reductase n=1 Tax=Streptacidiphilus jiangxiensis TaxID=235985 RepID=A0A1H7KJF1_STRJI|nr:FAD-dependent monooxygenase [Streptacidiphilus jiangxiensis]SEK86644.1 oxygenase/bifunctional oxygenase/reductase [Streptacidiphilus jiangxiensis]
MAPTRWDTDVVVVGAGPVGLLLAGELRLGGAEVIVLEQLGAPTTESRASTLHARTLELLDSRGLLERFGAMPREFRGHFGGLPLDLARPGPWPGPYPGQWKAAQTLTEKVLGAWAADLGARVLRGHRLRALRADDTGVEAVASAHGGPVRVRARHLVACDGENSTVRRLLDAPFPGQDARRELLRADVAGLDIRDRRFERLPQGLAIAARRPDGVTRVMVHRFGEPFRTRPGAPDFAEVAKDWLAVTGEDISGGEPLWVNAFGDANRQLAHYRHGRVLFAGDAAHVQMPAGGQALNLGLQDAFNLGWKLAAQVRGTAPEGLLDSYHAERRPVGRRVLADIAVQADLLMGGTEAQSLRELLGELLTLGPVQEQLAGLISGVDVDYGRETPDLLADGACGRRLPPLPLHTDAGPTTTAALQRTARGVLLVLDEEAAQAAVLHARAWADRVELVTARADADGPGPLAGVGALLLRPDGHLAWTSDDGDDPRPALRRWFGAPVTPAHPLPAAPRSVKDSR